MSEEKHKDIELHSEPVQDIIGRPPGWMVRSGITVIFLVLVVLLIGCCFIKYPEILSATIKINANNLPAQVKARSTGRIDTLFVKDGDVVNINQPLALIENTANYNDVLFLKKSLGSVSHDSVWICAKEMHLGDIQSSYLNYTQAAHSLSFFVKNDYLGELINSRKEQAVVLAQTLENYEKQIRLNNEKLSVEKEKFNIDSTLFTRGIMSKTNYNDSRTAFMQQCMSHQSLIIETDNIRLSLLQSKQTVTELEQQRSEQYNNLIIQFNVAREQLEASIRQWEQNYFLTSPIYGVVAITKYWQRNQNITTGETMLTVIPKDSSSHFGKIYLSQQGAGKVKTGQKVNIKLDDYPYMEFGFIQVKLSGISMVPYEESGIGNIFLLEVEMPDSLTTQYGISIPYRPEMSGTAEIITDDLTVFDRLINPIKAVFKK